jgi:pyruvate dehydrogenase E2 component (dihydrolipoamide acetyltransferase)
MPKFGLTMTEGKVASWAKPEGSHINIGEEIADIETTKITNAFESPVAGVLRRYVAREQEDLPVGALIAVVADPSVPDSEIDTFIAAFQAEFAMRPMETETAAARPQIVEGGGRRIRFLEAGGDHEGPPIVLIHGFGGDFNNWLMVQPVLAERYRVIALDLPGHGESSKDVGPGDIGTLAAALLTALDTLGLTATHLVGHSLGGVIALQATLTDPSRIKSLTLIASAGLGREIDDAFLRDFIAAARRKHFEPVLAKLFVDPGVVSREMVEDLLRFKRLDGAKEALMAIRAANFSDGQHVLLRDRLGELDQVPVQVIWGTNDRIIPVDHAEGLPANIRTHLLPGAGHMPHVEQAAEVSRLVLAFVDEVTD